MKMTFEQAMQAIYGVSSRTLCPKVLKEALKVLNG